MVHIYMYIHAFIRISWTVGLHVYGASLTGSGEMTVKLDMNVHGGISVSRMSLSLVTDCAYLLGHCT